MAWPNSLCVPPEVAKYGPAFTPRCDAHVEINVEDCHRGQTPAILEAAFPFEVPKGICADACYYTDLLIETAYVWAQYDPNIFSVSTGPPGQWIEVWISTFGPQPYKPIASVSVLRDDDEFLCASRDKSPTVHFYAASKYEIWGFTTGDVSPGSCWGYVRPSSGIMYKDHGKIASVGIHVNGSPVCDGGTKCKGGCPNSANSLGGNNNLLDNNATVMIGDYSASISMYQSQTMNMYAGVRELPNVSAPAVTWAPEVNLKGFWMRPGASNQWSRISSSDPYTHSNPSDLSSPVTKVQFTIQSPDGDKYYYEINGEWGVQGAGDNEGIAREATRRKIPLKEIRDQNDQLKYTYSYTDNRATIARHNVPHPYYIIYEGGFDTQNPADTLRRVWTGKNLSEYRSPDELDPENRTPQGGRWYDVQSTVQSGTDVAMITGVSECGDCGGSVQRYDYTPALTQDKRFLVSKIKGSDGTVLRSFDYDAEDRLKTEWLGNGEKRVKENIYEDIEWDLTNSPASANYDPSEQTMLIKLGDSNYRLTRDFVSDTQYRAKVFVMDANGAITKEVHYHQLQSYNPAPETNWLTGPYSVYSYVREGATLATRYPRGNMSRKYYDPKGNITKVQWEGTAAPDIQYTYEDYFYNGKTLSRVVTEINAYGGETVFTYEGLNLKTRTDPTPGTGISDSSQQVITYVYGSNNRIDYEYKKNSTESYVYTKYVYDPVGNLERTHENCTDYHLANPVTGLITANEYNEYNQLIQTTYPSGKIHKKFYLPSTGKLIAEADYESISENAVSAVIYVYEDGKLKAVKKAKANAPFGFTQEHAENGSAGTGITWVEETYLYNIYGRKEAVIADAGGMALKTEYEYNNQGEVTRVLQPDMRYKRTNRDGRGLVTEEITGVVIDNEGHLEEHPKAVTKFFYDLNGNLIRKVDPEGVTEIYQYDMKDRLIRVRYGK